MLVFKVLPRGPPGLLWWALPVFGFFTTGMHAGYAVYFPELFPTRLRGTGGGFCFNGGRLAGRPDSGPQRRCCAVGESPWPAAARPWGCSSCWEWWSCYLLRKPKTVSCRRKELV